MLTTIVTVLGMFVACTIAYDWFLDSLLKHSRSLSHKSKPKTQG